MEKKSGVGSQASSFSESLREGSSLQLDPQRSAGIRADQARPGQAMWVLPFTLILGEMISQSGK